LRTPINNLMGETEIHLSREGLSPECREVFESALEEYVRLNHLIEKVLFLARADNPQNAIVPVLFDAVEEIQKVSGFYESMVLDHGADIACHGEGMVWGDAHLFRRALVNLLANSLEYSPRGLRIDISVRQLGDRSVEVTVADNGIGIDEKDLPHVFERFYRGEKSSVAYAPGSGLGLPIVKSIMDLHSGTVTISSIPGAGTTVTLHFPAPPP
jgi:two-component system heavy metal sensor histidine kinase CusS